MTVDLIMAQMLSHHGSGALRPNHFLKISSLNTLKIEIWKSHNDSYFLVIFVLLLQMLNIDTILKP